jgi:hypothetical protein
MGFLHNLKEMIKTFQFNCKRFSFQLLYKVAPIVLLNKRVKSFKHTKLKINNNNNNKMQHSKLNAKNPKIQKNNKAKKKDNDIKVLNNI